MLATQHTMGNSLRWTRRLIVVILIVANLMAIMLAEAASASQSSLSYFPKVGSQQGPNVSMNYSVSTAGDEFGVSLESGENGANTPQWDLLTP